MTVGYVGQMADEYRDSGVPFLRSLNVRPHRIDLTDVKYVSREFHERLRKSSLRPGDVVTVRTGKPGQTARIPDWLLEANCSDLVITRPGPEVDAHWLSYYLNWVIDSHIAGHLVGAVQQHFNVKSAQGLILDLPSIREQRAIAEVLGALDDKIAANHRIARTALELARVMFQSEVGKLAVGAATLGELCAQGWLHLGDGYRTRRAEHGRPGFRILRAGDVQMDSITPSGEEFVSAVFRGSIGSKASEPGDIVMTTKGTVGRVAVVPHGMEQVVYSPQLCYFRVVECDQLVPGFLSGWFRSKDLQRQAAVRMFKSDMAPYINLQDVQSMVVPMIPRADQRQIGDAQSVLEQASYGAVQENRVLASARDTLLPLLMAGKVRVRDAEKLVGEVV